MCGKWPLGGKGKILTVLARTLKVIIELTVFSIPLFRLLRYRNRFPNLDIEHSANVKIFGRLVYGENVHIGEGSNINVPRDTRLTIGDGCYFGRYVEVGPADSIKIGEHTSIQDRCIFTGDVEIGKYCVFSLNVMVSSGQHYFDFKPELLIKDQDNIAVTDESLRIKHSKRVIIEDDCWIGMNVSIMRGVKIGKGAIVGANAVVTKDLPPYSVSAGVPARVIRRRLVFCPPKEIVYDRERDLPYFYSGFFVSEAERKRNEVYGGMLGGSEVQVYVSTENSSVVNVLAMPVECDDCMLCHGSLQIKMSKSRKAYKFEIANKNGGPLEFRVLGKKSREGVIAVTKIWCE